MDKTVEMLKRYFSHQEFSGQGGDGRGVTPDAEEFALYCQGLLEGARLERMQAYILDDRRAQEMVLEAKRLMSEEPENKEIPAGLAEKAKRLMNDSRQAAPCPHCGKAITPFKRPMSRQVWMNLLWLLLMTSSFALSFVFRRYFMQFLVVTVLAGVKWVVEMRASKTQIMIYRALSEEPQKHAHRLKEFQGKE